MRGRRILLGWLWEGRSKEAQKEAGWAGVMSLPRVLSLNADGSLCCMPAPALQTLRGESSHVQGRDSSH
jgi:beta-fructofuranosidase